MLSKDGKFCLLHFAMVYDWLRSTFSLTDDDSSNIAKCACHGLVPPKMGELVALQVRLDGTNCRCAIVAMENWNVSTHLDGPGRSHCDV